MYVLFFLDDDYRKKNIPPETEELSFEVSYSEMVTEAPKRSKFKKSDFKKEDYALTVCKTFHDYSNNFLWFSMGQTRIFFFFIKCVCVCV